MTARTRALSSRSPLAAPIWRSARKPRSRIDTWRRNAASTSAGNRTQPNSWRSLRRASAGSVTRTAPRCDSWWETAPQPAPRKQSAGRSSRARSSTRSKPPSCPRVTSERDDRAQPTSRRSMTRVPVIRSWEQRRSERTRRGTSLRSDRETPRCADPGYIGGRRPHSADIRVGRPVPRPTRQAHRRPELRS